MISVEDKVSVFSQYLLKNQRSKGKKIISDAKRNSDDQMKQAEIQLKQDKKRIQNHNENVIFRDKNKIIAEGKNGAKNELLKAQSDILADFKKTILSISKDYLGTPVYQNYLMKCINQIPMIFEDTTERLIFYTLPDDRDYIKKVTDEFLKKYNVSFENLDSIYQGGFIVKDAQDRMHSNFTISELIKENSKLIGHVLSTAMQDDLRKEGANV